MMGNRRNLWRFIWSVRREHNMPMNCLPNDLWRALCRTRFGGTTQTRLGRVNARLFLADARRERERIGED